MDDLQRLTDELMDSLIQGRSTSHTAYRTTITSQQVIIDELEREILMLKHELLQTLRQLRKLSANHVDLSKYHEEPQSEQEPSDEE